jgi:hypothetical protein
VKLIEQASYKEKMTPDLLQFALLNLGKIFTEKDITEVFDMKRNAVLGIGIILAIAVIWFYIPDDVSRYIFFLRVPILAGLFLIALPILAKTIASAILKNLFVLRGQWQLTFVIVSAIAAGMSILLSTAIIWNNAADRFAVTELATLPWAWQYGLAIAISLPICITTFDLSRERLRVKPRLAGAGIGIVLSLVLLFSVNVIRQWLATSLWLNDWLTMMIAFFGRRAALGYTDAQSGQLAMDHIAGIAALVVVFVTYALVGWLFKPQPTSNRPEAPALLFVMLILIEVTLLFSGSTFYLDYFRVPLLVILLIFSAVGYTALGVDHYFELKNDNRKDKGNDLQLQDFKAVIDKRLQHQTGDRTLVVVCASGGGIQAAGWTVQVLTGLQEILGHSFTQAIGLMSTVSGGSVGTMFYLDRFTDKGYPDLEYVDERGASSKNPSHKNTFTTIFNSATKDGLDAIGWGLAYLDLWRFAGLACLVNPKFDRGTALETDWQGEMQNPKQEKTLATWRKQVIAGQIPVPVFNATLVEDGQRLLLSPMTFGANSDQKSVDSNTLYNDYDIDVVTAARLSATFPYVSPICRNDRKLDKNYHIADGGYFDNSGFTTAVEWLNKWLEPEKDLKIKRVLILQINAFPKAEEQPNKPVKGEAGWAMATLGPLKALYTVRDPILAARNEASAKTLKQVWEQKGVKVEYIPIFFPSKSCLPAKPEARRAGSKTKTASSELKVTSFYDSDQYQPPLSWKLTDNEKQAIKAGWEAYSSQPQGVVEEIKKLWHQTWEMPRD